LSQWMAPRVAPAPAPLEIELPHCFSLGARLARSSECGRECPVSPMGASTGVARGPQGQDASLFLTGGQQFCFSAGRARLGASPCRNGWLHVLHPRPSRLTYLPVFHWVGVALGAASSAGNAPLRARPLFIWLLQHQRENSKKNLSILVIKVRLHVAASSLL
jgi:hypothetical protein